MRVKKGRHRRPFSIRGELNEVVTLDPSVLQSVEKPARYTGSEWNAVIKDHAAVKCTFALALPDVYEVGMSNLGLAILYEILNSRADIAAERVYAPWTDMEAIMREQQIRPRRHPAPCR